MIVAVTGATGALGALVLEILQARGVSVRALTRRDPPDSARRVKFVRADMASGLGLEAAFAGAQAILHLAHDRDALANDALCLRNVAAAALDAKIPHLVYTGICGIESAAELSYYAGKLHEEHVLQNSGMDFTIQRLAQFHSLTLALLLRHADESALRIPDGLILRSLDPQAAAHRLAHAACGPPQGRADDCAGPQGLDLAGYARAWQAHKGDQRALRIEAVADAQMAAMAKLTHGPAATAGRSFADWLSAERPAAAP